MKYHIFDLVSPETVEETRRVFAVRNDLGVCLYDDQGKPISNCDLQLGALAHLPTSVRQLFRLFYRIDHLDTELAFAQGLPIYRAYDQGRILQSLIPLLHRNELIGIACLIKIVEKIDPTEQQGLLAFLQRYENDPQRLRDLASPSPLAAQQALSAAVEELQKNFRLLFEAGEARLQLYEQENPHEITRSDLPPRDTLSAARQGLIFCSSDGVVLDAQAAAAALLGFSSVEDVCGLKVPEHLPITESSKELFRRSLQDGAGRAIEVQTIRGSSLRAEFRLQKDAGQLIGFECRLVESTPQAAFESAQDKSAAELIITQEQEPPPLEDLLSQQNAAETPSQSTEVKEPEPPPSPSFSWQATAEILEHHPLPALVFDAENRVKVCNPAMADLLGIESEVLVERPLLNLVVANSHSMVERWKQYLLQSEKSFVLEPKVFLPIIRKDSSVITVRVRLLRLFAAPAGFVLFVESESEQTGTTPPKTTEEKPENSSDLQKAQEFAKRVRRQFAALAEQLADVVSSSYLDSLVNEETKKRFSALKRLSERASMVDRQLAFFTGEFVPQFAYVNLNEILHKVAVGLRQFLPKTVELHTAFDPALPPIQGDAALLVQMIGMLCRNAAEAMPNGGVLTLRTRCKDGMGELQISDTGRGIDPSIRPRLFFPFYSSKGTGFGKGLGLAAVYGIARAHHGSLSFSPNQPSGTTVTFCLPASGPKTMTKAAVLIIDDRIEALEGAAMLLERAGYSVCTCSTCDEALELLKSGLTFDLVMLDNNLQGCKGTDCALKIRALKPKMPILFCSGSCDEELMRFISLYGCGFISKPYQKRELIEKIQGVLHSRR
ncbi:MAG: response regulator [candidate division KSB1 bacterium]|nr:response regulator [candidate division KSB1 bacterium]MDZ7345325.1 response regulator [candidate division KSB1 bacterium]